MDRHASAELLLRGTRLTRVLDVFRDSDENDLPGGDVKGIALESCAVVDNGARPTQLAALLARYQQEVAVVNKGTVDLPSFAERIVDAYHAEPEA